jgi:hypothetical protein
MAKLATASRAGGASARVQRNPNANYGTQIDQLGGITVGRGTVLCNLDPDKRFHNIRLQVTAVNYKGGLALVPVVLTGVGVVGTLTLDLAVNAFGVPGLVTVHSGTETGFVTGDTVTVPDATGDGVVITITAAAGSVTGAVVSFIGTPTAAPVGQVLGIAQLLVNGSPVRDVEVQQTLNMMLFNNISIAPLGQMPFFFTEPWRNFTRWPDITSWDMVGQNTFSIKIAINPGWQDVSVVGTYEFDYNRNTVYGVIDQATYQSALAQGKAPAPMLHIIAHHAFTPTLNAGANILTGAQIPITAPILRMHCEGSTPGDLTQSILLQDSNTVESGFIGTQNAGAQLDQLREELIERGFDTSIFDYSYVADKGQRIQDALKFASSMKWSLYSAIAQGLTVLQETLHALYE